MEFDQNTEEFCTAKAGKASRGIPIDRADERSEPELQFQTGPEPELPICDRLERSRFGGKAENLKPF